LKTSHSQAHTRFEAKAIKDAAARFGANYKPKLTFVICAKRVTLLIRIGFKRANSQHSMRFFATKAEDTDKTGNLQAGRYWLE